MFYYLYEKSNKNKLDLKTKFFLWITDDKDYGLLITLCIRYIGDA